MLLMLPASFSSPLLPELLGAVRDLGPQLLQAATVVSGGGGAVTGGGGGAVTGVTTLPAPIATTVTTPVMSTMAPGIALGILKALLVGRAAHIATTSQLMVSSFSSDYRKYQEAS